MPLYKVTRVERKHTWVEATHPLKALTDIKKCEGTRTFVSWRTPAKVDYEVSGEEEKA